MRLELRNPTDAAGSDIAARQLFWMSQASPGLSPLPRESGPDEHILATFCLFILRSSGFVPLDTASSSKSRTILGADDAKRVRVAIKGNCRFSGTPAATHDATQQIKRYPHGLNMGLTTMQTRCTLRTAVGVLPRFNPLIHINIFIVAFE